MLPQHQRQHQEQRFHHSHRHYRHRRHHHHYHSHRRHPPALEHFIQQLRLLLPRIIHLCHRRRQQEELLLLLPFCSIEIIGSIEFQFNNSEGHLLLSILHR